MQTLSCNVLFSNFPDKHFVTAEMKELIENKFRHPEKNESCHTSVSMCSSKREGRNRLMYMSGPVHVSLHLKKRLRMSRNPYGSPVTVIWLLH